MAGCHPDSGAGAFLCSMDYFSPAPSPPAAAAIQAIHHVAADASGLLDDCHCLGKPRRYGLLGTRPPPPTYLLPPTILNAACHTHERTGHTTLSRRGGCRPGRSCGVAHRPLLGINNIPAGLGIARNLSSPSLSPRYPIAQSTRRNGTPSKRSGPGGSVALPTRQLVIRRAGEPAPSGVLLLPDEALLPYSDGS